MNLYGREMRAHRKSLLIWIAGIIVMLTIGMGEYTSMEESGNAMNALLADMPKALKALMGIGELDIGTPLGYYGVLFLYLLLMAAIHASMLGAAILSKEERDKTAEFLLAKPLSRRRLLVYKLLAALTNVVIFNVVMLVSSLLVVGAYGQGETTAPAIVFLLMGMLLVQVVFLTVGMAIAGAGRQPKRAVAFSASAMLLTFLLSMAIEISGHIDYLRFLTPFQYVDAAVVMDTGIEASYTLLSLGISALSLIILFVGYNRRDMK
ncbi:ABC transporter permease subunit [Paenibacillus paeoniae]|uniref:ABC transporter n=1 Tax=Paenibacillus paeoniae TaxID=2292705 RepID=A0A371P7B3_9BACL|nr:ABC transporter permease subunit [Paenibacillus paeoniae]REK71812.1 ABC transporter [Paenibacillus paeoniae]